MCVCEDVLGMVMVMGMRLEVEMQMWDGTGTDTGMGTDTAHRQRHRCSSQRSACVRSHTLLRRAIKRKRLVVSRIRHV